MDTIIAQEYGQGRGFERIPVREALPGHEPSTGTTQGSDLISIPEEEWRAAVRQFEILKPLLKLSRTQRTSARVRKAAAAALVQSLGRQSKPERNLSFVI